MKTAIALLLVSSLAFADPPPAATPPADAPIADLPGTSVHLTEGQAAPFAGRLLSDSENLRRAKAAVDCKSTLDNAEANGVLLPKPAVAALISVAAAAVITSIVTGIALAAKK